MARTTYNYDAMLIDEATHECVYYVAVDGDGWDAFYTLDNGQLFAGFMGLAHFCDRMGLVYVEW